MAPELELTLNANDEYKEIDSIIMSRDSSRIQALNSTRRAAGEAMILSLLNSINRDALQARAEALRGLACSVSLPTPDKAYFNPDILGGCNYHAPIVFEDGVIWLARFRLPNHNAPPTEERNLTDAANTLHTTF